MGDTATHATHDTSGHGHGHAGPRELGPRRIDSMLPKAKNFAVMCAVVGGLMTLLALIWPQFRERLAASYLVAFSYYLSITIGAVFFVVLQHLVRAGWSVVVRRVAEGLAMNMMLMIVLFIPAAVAIHMGGIHVQPGAHHGAGHGDPAAHGDPAHGEPAHEDHAPAHTPAPTESADRAPTLSLASDPVVRAGFPGSITQAHGRGAAVPETHPEMQKIKTLWLSPTFLVARIFGYIVLWLLLASFYRRLSVAQDASGDVNLTNKMQWWAPACMLMFAFSTALCGFDLLMAIDPTWYSTMFGVYFFAGCAQSFFAALAITLYALQRNGLVREVTGEHYHDVGKLMFAFVIFWAYVGFSQFMLIWYGNIPEEVVWFQRRIDGGWIWVSALLILGGFFVPFLGMLSRFGKRRPQLLLLGAAWCLVMHYIDLMWLVLPEPGKYRSAPVPLLDVGLAIALGGIYIYSTVGRLSGASLIPERDPRLPDSLNHENF